MQENKTKIKLIRHNRTTSDSPKKIILGTPNDYTFSEKQKKDLEIKSTVLESIYSLVLVDPVKYKKDWFDKAGESIG